MGVSASPDGRHLVLWYDTTLDARTQTMVDVTQITLLDTEAGTRHLAYRRAGPRHGRHVVVERPGHPRRRRAGRRRPRGPRADPRRRHVRAVAHAEGSTLVAGGDVRAQFGAMANDEAFWVAATYTDGFIGFIDPLTLVQTEYRDFTALDLMRER